MGGIGSLAGILLALAAMTSTVTAATRLPDAHPNILFFVLDDVGIDQMKVFGYGGATPPRTPNIDTIASAGVAFRNFWTMPECSPSRALMFEGRYPLRTNVLRRDPLRRPREFAGIAVRDDDAESAAGDAATRAACSASST